MITEENFEPEIDDAASVSKATNETEVNLDSSSTCTPKISAENEHGNRSFDADKVARIRAQLAFGSYEINPERIVSKMITDKT